MARPASRLLLVLVCSFAALSSSAAAALGLEAERIFLFTGLTVTLLLLPFLFRPRIVRPSGPLLVLFVLYLLIALIAAAGELDPLDLKIGLPLLVILAAPNLCRHISPVEATRFAWRFLSLYVAATFAYQLLAEPAAIARGHEGIVRYDPMGSVVMHSSLSLIHLVMAIARLASLDGWPQRLVTLALAIMSLTMVLLTGTRTALVTGLLFLSFMVLTSRDPARSLSVALLAVLGGALAFAAYTLLVSDGFYLRLVGAQEDYSSGRWSSLRHWLQLSAEQPFGLGLGAVRRLLADGRPAIDGITLLEWPHNELVRFYVEAGPLGLAFILLLIGLLVHWALRAARHADQPARRALLLVIAADLVAESLLQNLFNAVYHATVLVLVASLAAGRCPLEPARARPRAMPLRPRPA